MGLLLHRLKALISLAGAGHGTWAVFEITVNILEADSCQCLPLGQQKVRDSKSRHFLIFHLGIDGNLRNRAYG
jgi:hypothetical protein